MTSFSGTLAAGLALGGVLALAASWSRGARAGALPQLGVGAVAALGVALAARLAPLPWPLAAALVVTAGALAGFAALLVEQRLAGAPPLAADLAVLAGVAAIALLAAPDPEPLRQATLLGGGWPQALPGWLGPVVAALAVVVVVLLARVPPTVLEVGLRWALAGGSLALLGALAGGQLSGTVFGVPQPLALGLGAGAAGAAGGAPGRAGACGLALGLAATLLQRVGVPAALVIAAVAVLLAGLPAGRAREAGA